MIICERPAPPDDNLQETGWRDRRRRRRKRRRKKRRRKRILAHGPIKSTRGPRGPKKRDKKVRLAYLDPVAGGPMVAVAYFAPSDFFLSNHRKNMLQNNRMNTQPFKNSGQNNFEIFWIYKTQVAHIAKAFLCSQMIHSVDFSKVLISKVT